MNQNVPNIEPTKPQTLALMVDQGVDLALLGSRGWGKSFLIILLCFRFCLEFGEQARCLIVRRTYGALMDLEDTLRTLATKVFGPAANYRKAERVLELPGGGRIELSQMETRAHYDRFQGREFGLIAADEATQHPDPTLIDLLRTNLRAPTGIPTRFIVAANPGGRGMQWAKRRYVTGRRPWEVYTEDVSGRQTMTCTAGTDTNSANIDVRAYFRQLAAGTGGEQSDLYRAWATGDWDVLTEGAFFADLDLRAIELDPDLWTPKWLHWHAKNSFEPGYGRVPTYQFEWSIDHGFSGSPCVALLCAEPPHHRPDTPDDREIHKDALLILDEVALHDPNDPGRGAYMDVPEICYAIKRSSLEWGVEPNGILDAAAFAQHGSKDAPSIGDEYKRNGVRVRPSKKGPRPHGLQQIRSRIAAANDPDSPQLFISRRCRYLLEQLATAQRHETKPDDIHDPDDAIDALRYAVAGIGAPTAAAFSTVPFFGR